MGYSSFHETSNICPEIVAKGARKPPSGAALQGDLRPSPIPDTARQRPRQLAAQGYETSLWTLEMAAEAAEAAFEEGLTEKKVSGETIRATLSRLLGIRWQRAKRWITSPDPLYERKKGGATG